MLFHTSPFALFLAVTLVGYWLLPWRRGRVAWLVAASCYFYASWNPWFIGLIVFSAGLDFLIAGRLERTADDRARRRLVAAGVSTNLALLGYFKYANFFLDAARAGLERWGLSASLPVLEVVLPLGISFYTFESISYVVDVYRGRVRAARSLLDFRSSSCSSRT